MKRPSIIAVAALLLAATLAQAQSESRYVVLFTAQSCSACPPSKALAEQYGIRIVDGDRERSWAQNCGVRAYPTWVVIIAGNVVDRYEGTPSVERLRELMGSGTRTYPDASPPSLAPNGRPSFRDTTVQIQAGRYGGSGVIVGSQNGKSLILTAQHVTAGGEPYTVTTTQGKFTARLFGDSRSLDLAALIVEQELPAAPLATEEPQPGDRAILCGFGGNRWKELSGTVKGYARHSTHETTDIAVTPRAISGDSGGPLYNDRGEVIGVLWGGPSTLGGRLHYTQGVRPRSIDGWFDGSRTTALADIFGPHSRVPVAEQDIRALQERIAQLEREQSQSNIQGISLAGVQAELSALRNDLAAMNSRVLQTEAVANTARDLYRNIEPHLPAIRDMVARNLPEQQRQEFERMSVQWESRIATAREEIKRHADAEIARLEAEQAAEIAATERKANEAISAAAGARMEAQAASAEATAAKSSVADTVKNAIANYAASRANGSTREEAGLSIAEQALRDRGRGEVADLLNEIAVKRANPETTWKDWLTWGMGGALGVGLWSLKKSNPMAGYAASGAVKVIRTIRHRADGTPEVTTEEQQA